MLCRLLFRVLVVCGGLANALPWQRFTSDLTLATECLVGQGEGDVGVRDLCPLAIKRRIARYDNSAQADSGRSRIVLELGKEDPELEDSLRECPPGSWICMKALDDLSPKPPRPISITASFEGEGTQVSGEDLRTPSIPSQTEVEKAHIVFICDQQAQSQSLPELIGESNGVVLFSWHTKYACRQSSTSPNRFTVTEEDSTPSEGDPEDKPEGEQELIQRPIPASQLRSTTIIIFLSLSGIIALGYAFYSQQTVIRRLVSEQMKPFRFRVGEGRLVQWAQEDMGFLEDEVDIMVNGGMDEHIPLKPSPRLGHSFTNYGSAK